MLHRASISNFGRTHAVVGRDNERRETTRVLILASLYLINACASAHESIVLTVTVSPSAQQHGSEPRLHLKREVIFSFPFFGRTLFPTRVYPGRFSPIEKIGEDLGCQ